MKSFVKIGVAIVISITAAHATLDGTKVRNSVMLSPNTPYGGYKNNIPSSDSIVHCDEKGNKFNNDGKITNFSSINLTISQNATCNRRYITYGRFTPDGCASAIDCRKNFNAMIGKASEKFMKEVVAKNYAKNFFNSKTDLMDRLEILKRFSESEYNIKAPNCTSSYKSPARNNSCNLSLLDEVFLADQASCHDGSGCFNKSKNNALAFKDYKLNNKLSKNSDISDYNEYRINQKLMKMKEEDEALIQTLATLIVSDKFKSLTLEQQADRFLKELESSSDDFYKDPVFGYGLGRVTEKENFKKSGYFKEALKFFEKPFASEDAFKTIYKNYRKEIAEKILNDSKACSNNIDLKMICEEMTAIANGEKVFRNSLEVEALSSTNLREEKDYEKFKNYGGEFFGKSEYEILLNAQRCISFELGNEENSYSNAHVSTQRSKNSLNEDIRELLSPNVSIVTKTRIKGQSAVRGDEFKIDSNTSRQLEPIAAGEEKKIALPAVANTQAPIDNSSSQFPQNFNPVGYDPNVDDKNDKKVDSSQTTKPTSVATIDNNINDLMKRLTAAEDKVDKMKAANEEAEVGRATQKKIDQENLLIKELKDQIADLKVEKTKLAAVAKEAAVANPVNEQQKSQSNNFSSSFNSGIVSAPARQETAPKVVESYDSGRSQGSAPAATSTAGSKGVSSAILNSTSSNNESSKVQPSGSTFTIVDGMTSEKMIQTISNRIIELKGTPFYIEEGGMIKEIIAVMKDGKIVLDEKGNPVYEKVIKGKIGDKKFANVADQKRAPTAINNVADLKRDQEEKLKRERAEYLKLKNLTNGVINKK